MLRPSGDPAVRPCPCGAHQRTGLLARWCSWNSGTALAGDSTRCCARSCGRSGLAGSLDQARAKGVLPATDGYAACARWRCPGDRRGFRLWIRSRRGAQGRPRPEHNGLTGPAGRTLHGRCRSFRWTKRSSVPWQIEPTIWRVGRGRRAFASSPHSATNIPAHCLDVAASAIESPPAPIRHESDFLPWITALIGATGPARPTSKVAYAACDIRRESALRKN